LNSAEFLTIKNATVQLNETTEVDVNYTVNVTDNANETLNETVKEKKERLNSTSSKNKTII